jgi:hypothetical protein
MRLRWLASAAFLLGTYLYLFEFIRCFFPFLLVPLIFVFCSPTLERTSMWLGFALAGWPRRPSPHSFWSPANYFLFGRSFPEGLRRIHKALADSVHLRFRKKF